MGWPLKQAHVKLLRRSSLSLEDVGVNRRDLERHPRHNGCTVTPQIAPFG